MAKGALSRVHVLFISAARSRRRDLCVRVIYYGCIAGKYPVSTYLKFKSCSSVGYGGSDLHSLQSWTAVTAAQVQLGGSNCTNCKVGLQSLQINFTAAQVQLRNSGGGT